MREPLRIELGTLHLVALLGAVELARAWGRMGGGGVRVGPPWFPGDGPTVRLGLGSLVRPSVVLQFARPYAAAAAAAADSLALTTAAWDALGLREPWRELQAPLQRLPHLGVPSPSARWLVSLPGRSRAAAGESQLHLIGGLPSSRDGVVWWPAVPRVVAAVLGRAHAVLGRDNPLIYDAVRAGVDLEEEGHALVSPGALAGLVPPSLMGSDQLWDQVANTARRVHRHGETPEPLMTPAWVARGRERIRDHQAAPPSRLERLHRRYLKLQRDPRGFFTDSRHPWIRAFGRFAGGQEAVAKRGL